MRRIGKDSNKLSRSTTARVTECQKQATERRNRYVVGKTDLVQPDQQSEIDRPAQSRLTPSHKSGFDQSMESISKAQPQRFMSPRPTRKSRNGINVPGIACTLRTRLRKQAFRTKLTSAPETVHGRLHASFSFLSVADRLFKGPRTCTSSETCIDRTSPGVSNYICICICSPPSIYHEARIKFFRDRPGRLTLRLSHPT